MLLVEISNQLRVVNYSAVIFLVALDMLREALAFFIIPVLATFINSEFNLGKNFKASAFFFPSISKFIFLMAFLYLLLRGLFTIVCFDILLIVLIADFVFAISAVV